LGRRERHENGGKEVKKKKEAIEEATARSSTDPSEVDNVNFGRAKKKISQAANLMRFTERGKRGEKAAGHSGKYLGVARSFEALSIGGVLDL